MRSVDLVKNSEFDPSLPSGGALSDGATGRRVEYAALNKGPHRCDAVKLYPGA